MHSHPLSIKWSIPNSLTRHGRWIWTSLGRFHITLFQKISTDIKSTCIRNCMFWQKNKRLCTQHWMRSSTFHSLDLTAFSAEYTECGQVHSTAWICGLKRPDHMSGGECFGVYNNKLWVLGVDVANWAWRLRPAHVSLASSGPGWAVCKTVYIGIMIL